MTFFQVQGISRVKKTFLGLSWRTYEAFYDDRLLNEHDAASRMQDLRQGIDCPQNIDRFDSLYVRKVTPGTYIDAGQQVDFIFSEYHFTRF